MSPTLPSLLLRGGRVIDPRAGRDEVTDIRIEHGRIAAIGSLEPHGGEQVQEVGGLLVTPGLVDLCVHLREPGFEDLETIRSGACAAVAGGFTSIAAMPDTDPPVDNEASVINIRLKGQQASAARVYAVGALTRGRHGDHLSEMGGMARAGAVAFSDEEDSVEHSDVFLRALRYARMLERPVLTRCEDRRLRGNGVASSGLQADLLGLPAISPGTEELMVQRNLRLARIESAKVHLLHLSTADSLHEVDAARQFDVTVTCSATPAHLLFAEEAIRDYDPMFKFRPPLRAESDRLALVAALRDGGIDAISSAHAPRGEGAKSVEFVYAADGTGGLETTFAVLYTRLVLEGDLPLARLIEVLSTAPADILGIPGGGLAVGDPADISCFDLEGRWTIEPEHFQSRCRLTPYSGWSVQGRPRHVLVGGRACLENERNRPDGR